MTIFRNTVLAMSMICLGLPMFTSCEEDEVQEWELLKFNDQSSGTYGLTYWGGKGPTYTIYTNGEWEISSDVDWLTFSQLKGKGNATITTTVEKNNSSDNRNAKVRIKGGKIDDDTNIAGLYNQSEYNYSSYNVTQPSFYDYVSSYVSIDNFTGKVTGTYDKESSSYLYEGYVEFDIVNNGDIKLELQLGTTEITIDGSVYSALSLTKEFTPFFGKNRIVFSAIGSRPYFSVESISPTFIVSDGELTKKTGVKSYSFISISRQGY